MTFTGLPGGTGYVVDTRSRVTTIRFPRPAKREQSRQAASLRRNLSTTGIPRVAVIPTRRSRPTSRKPTFRTIRRRARTSRQMNLTCRMSRMSRMSRRPISRTIRRRAKMFRRMSRTRRIPRLRHPPRLRGYTEPAQAAADWTALVAGRAAAGSGSRYAADRHPAMEERAQAAWEENP